MPITCPHCGSTCFTAYRPITVWQSVTFDSLDATGRYEEVDNNLHDTLDTGAFEGDADCAECAKTVPLTHLFPPTD